MAFLTLAELRVERNRLLSASDWVLFEDSNCNEAVRLDARIYRQRLRDCLEGVTDELAPEVVLPRPADPNLARKLGI